MYDLWITRDHMSNYNDACHVGDDIIEISNACETEVIKESGCCQFLHRNDRGFHQGKEITTATCRRRFDFLPRPGECWNVWSEDGKTIYFRLHPLFLKKGNRFSKKVYPKVEHKSEKKWYL